MDPRKWGGLELKLLWARFSDVDFCKQLTIDLVRCICPHYELITYNCLSLIESKSDAKPDLASGDGLVTEDKLEESLHNAGMYCLYSFGFLGGLCHSVINQAALFIILPMSP